MSLITKFVQFYFWLLSIWNEIPKSTREKIIKAIIVRFHDYFGKYYDFSKSYGG
jgi:hypothetical protein